MLPDFPQFKNLELSDKEEIEKITTKYPPYSDFNFVSMWAWDIKGEMRVSKLNENLVVKFSDYITGEPFYSFLGDNKVNETVETLLDFTIEKEVKPKIYLIPNETAQKIESAKFEIEEDLDNFDYIFDLNKISEFSGGQFAKKRNKITQLVKKFPDVKVDIIDITDGNMKNKILKLNELWSSNKIQKDSNFKTRNELLATERFLQYNLKETIGMGVFINKELVGYSIISFTHYNYAISHFTKADTQFAGIYDFLMKEIAKILIKKTCFFLNYEQDLGLPGLRESKKSFLSQYLKKFTVSFIH